MESLLKQIRVTCEIINNLNKLYFMENFYANSPLRQAGPIQMQISTAKQKEISEALSVHLAGIHAKHYHTL